MIDIDSLMKGEEYDKLFGFELGVDDYVTKPFSPREVMARISVIMKRYQNQSKKQEHEKQKHFGLPCYTFRNVCAENTSVNLDDKTVKVVYNASAYEKEEDSLIRAFLHFIYTGEPGEDNLSNRLSELVEQYKENETSRSDYLAVNLHDYDIRYEALQEGTQIGTQNKAVEDALMLIREYEETPEIAAKKTNAPLEKVLEALKTK